MDSKKRAGRAKSATTSVENQALRDTINASHFQLMKCQEELKHTKDQLRCLIHLIKRLLFSITFVTLKALCTTRCL